jgi:hypothetical protein
MSWNNNIRYNPEEHGLTFIGEVELSEPCYSFDLLAVWRDKDGYYLATDSGCSCPTPFENYNGKADLTGPLTKAQVIEESRNIYDLSGELDYEPEAFEKFIKTIEETA